MAKKTHHYHLLANWLCTIECKLTIDEKDIDWTFSFFIDEKITFIQVYEIAKSILIERFSEVGWKIHKISMVNSE